MEILGGSPIDSAARAWRSVPVRKARVRRYRLEALLATAGFCSLIAVAFWTNVSSVLACEIPVFRYALEHWAAAPYGVVVFYRG